MSEGDPVAWFLIENGWKVTDQEGSDVGEVEGVLGDENADIFHGLMITTGVLGGRRYVAAEQVGPITEGRIHLRLGTEEVKGLPENADV